LSTANIMMTKATHTPFCAGEVQNTTCKHTDTEQSNTVIIENTEAEQ
jgi:hypothetical protein